MDQMVLATQNWLNKTYGGDPRYNIIPESQYGKTGWTTIYALTRALQIELGIQQTSDNFGPTTQSLYQPLVREDGICKNQFYILQGALWCKGYNTGHYGTLIDGKYYIEGSFDESVENAVKQLQSDAGRSSQTGIVDLNTMKALLSMDYFVSIEAYGGDENIRTIQQYLNGNYENYIGLRPCDGIYGRSTNTAMIYAIQAEEGLPTSVANGNFGPTTKNCCPAIPYSGVQKSYTGTTYNATKISKFIKLLQMALYVNGFGNTIFDGIYSTSTQNAVSEFQKHYALSITGTVNLGTWLSLLTSCGDTSRSAIACDCATILTEEKAQTLYNAGYRYVGRYLSGTIVGGASKALSIQEMQIAFNAGLRIFPIHQGSATYIDYFTEEQALADVESAYTHATNLNIPTNTVIYFAVDCDPQDWQITNNIIPYFAKIYSTMVNSYDNKYKIGIYGTRNVCSRVCNVGYAVSSFVGDMSTGFSGNLGFSIPENWAFDQFTTVTIGSGTGQIEIDKDGFSGRDKGIGSLGTSEINRVYYNLQEIYNLALAYKNHNIQEANILTLQYLRHLANGEYGVDDIAFDKWGIMAGEIDGNFCLVLDAILSNLDLSFTDPIDNSVSYDILHMAATLNALLFSTLNEEFSAFDDLLDNYAGWAGDTLTFARDIRNNNWTQEETNQIVCSSESTSSFSRADYFADADAINIAQFMKNSNTLTFPEIFLRYFDQVDLETGRLYAADRTTRFMDAMGTYNTFLTTCDTIIRSDIFPYPNLRNLILNDGIDYSTQLDMSMIAVCIFIGNELIREGQ
jgi:peptidoglycan hydrolase-like protein with peptidoglycan-binding domain